MSIKELVSAIATKHEQSGITLNPPASISQIISFERRIGFELPDDFTEFYLLCNGFSCEEDLFTMIGLEDILANKRHYGKHWFHFSEYMTYCGMWSLRKTSKNTFEIFAEEVLTSSLAEFLSCFLEGDVFEAGGLYDWRAE
ncbi:SMI1/KNR4 family protein [Hymenobacter sp. HSC-4F20]|uniref:SMI1/KNR4 family protein n=1 Tax=Hymenobacter sp. HSC-4F20 TaxID=2864135 RepID=UPI001C734119|nr:SMI1/KNR4 family protein [Hymenobacter sp. HSC-4F20]MBX0289184.1 SMI1/KNR4 family protein [Hymenobacter sp. HSC-4F20]